MAAGHAPTCRRAPPPAPAAAPARRPAPPRAPRSRRRCRSRPPPRRTSGRRAGTAAVGADVGEIGAGHGVRLEQVLVSWNPVRRDPDRRRRSRAPAPRWARRRGRPWRGALGWALKPEGLCRDETCVPLLGRSGHRGAGAARGRTTRTAASRRWRRPPRPTTARPPSGKAPRLDLQDVDGNPVSFDDLSGHKRVLVTWASWCGCRHELGRLAAAPGRARRLRAPAVLGRPRRTTPRTSRPWIEAAHPSYPVAVDTAHVTAERYGITNVPSVVWVDEDDRIVKPPTIAPGDDQFVEFTQDRRASSTTRRCAAGSARACCPRARAPRRTERTDAEQRALAERRVAAHLQRQRRHRVAKRHLAAAQELAPWDWTVRRGGIAMTGGDPFLGEEFTSFWEEWDASGRPGYTPTT